MYQMDPLINYLSLLYRIIIFSSLFIKCHIKVVIKMYLIFDFFENKMRKDSLCIGHRGWGCAMGGGGGGSQFPMSNDGAWIIGITPTT